jgi:hypothetical protein
MNETPKASLPSQSDSRGKPPVEPKAQAEVQAVVDYWPAGSDKTLTPIYLYEETTSVFDLAWKLYGDNRLPVWGSVLAKIQTKGRGRAGRPWYSPAGHVYAALRLPVEPPFVGTSASIGLALLISLVLEEMFSLKTMIKWPNDIVLDKKKVGGLLLEARNDAIIAGIGLNLISPPDWAPAEPGLDKDKVGGQSHGHSQDTGQGKGPGTETEGTESARERGDVGAQSGVYVAPLAAGALPISESPQSLWRKLVEKTLLCYNLILTGPEHPPEGAITPMDLAVSRLMGLGQKVAILSPSTEPPFPGRVLTGVLFGLASSGALLIKTDHGVFAVWSGSLFFE